MFEIVIAEIDPAKVAVAAANEPPPPLKLIVGAVSYPVPPSIIVTELTIPDSVAVAVAVTNEVQPEPFIGAEIFISGVTWKLPGSVTSNDLTLQFKSTWHPDPVPPVGWLLINVVGKTV